MSLTKYKVVATVTAAYPPVQAQLFAAGGPVTTPAVPASTVAVQNPAGFAVSVVISLTTGTISAVIVNGVTVGTAAGTYVIPPAGTISVTWATATPTWVWSAVPSGGPGPDVALASSGPSLQQATWPAGTIIEFDPSTAAGLALQAAIGSSNLVAWSSGDGATGGSIGTSN
jgi:hypothetical protein